MINASRKWQIDEGDKSLYRNGFALLAHRVSRLAESERATVLHAAQNLPFLPMPYITKLPLHDTTLTPFSPPSMIQPSPFGTVWIETSASFLTPRNERGRYHVINAVEIVDDSRIVSN